MTNNSTNILNTHAKIKRHFSLYLFYLLVIITLKNHFYEHIDIA